MADFHRAFEKSWHQCFLPRGHCDIKFGSSTVRSILNRNLIDLVPDNQGTPRAPSTALSTRRGRRANSRQDLIELMCSHDIVVFESGTEDMALPVTQISPLRDPSLLEPACSGRSVSECMAVLPSALQNESWRYTPLAAYRQRLSGLVDVWKDCRRQKPHWRGIFKLSSAPRARAVRLEREPADCSSGQSGYSASAHHMAVVNSVARRLVESAGFETFDPWAATFHAAPSWFDALPVGRGRRKAHPSSSAGSRGLDYEIHSAEAVSDMVTQQLLNQLCTPG